jgi:hypothetical protein
MKKFANSSYRVLFLFLILAVLGGSEFFHHHETPEAESHCQACILSHMLTSSDVSAEPVIQSFFSFEYIKYNLELREPESSYSSSISSRAPPYSS